MTAPKKPRTAKRPAGKPRIDEYPPRDRDAPPPEKTIPVTLTQAQAQMWLGLCDLVAKSVGTQIPEATRAALDLSAHVQQAAQAALGDGPPA